MPPACTVGTATVRKMAVIRHIAVFIFFGASRMALSTQARLNNAWLALPSDPQMPTRRRVDAHSSKNVRGELRRLKCSVDDLLEGGDWDQSPARPNRARPVALPRVHRRVNLGVHHNRGPEMECGDVNDVLAVLVLRHLTFCG